MVTWFIIIAALLYVLIAMAYLSERTSWYKCDEKFNLYEGHREATTEDAWISMIWPVILIISLGRTSIWVLNEAVVLPCLLVGFRYKETNLYKRLDKISD